MKDLLLFQRDYEANIPYPVSATNLWDKLLSPSFIVGARKEVGHF